MSACPDCPIYDGNRNPDIPPRSTCCLEKTERSEGTLAKAKELDEHYFRLNRHERRKAAAMSRRRSTP